MNSKKFEGLVVSASMTWHHISGSSSLVRRKLELANAATIRRYVQDLRNVPTDGSLAERRNIYKRSINPV